MKHKVARAKSWLDELTFGTFDVRTAAVRGVNGIGLIDSLPRPCTYVLCMYGPHMKQSIDQPGKLRLSIQLVVG